MMSVPEMMLSSNFVALRLRPATNAAMPARIARAPATIAHIGMLVNRSLKNPAGSFTGAAALGFAGGDAAFDSGAFAASAAAGVSAAFVSGAFGASALFIGSAAFAGSGAGVAAGAVVTAADAGAVAIFAGSPALPFAASACD